MAGPKRPDESARTGSGSTRDAAVAGDDLDDRRRRLETALSARRGKEPGKEEEGRSAGNSGFAQALKLSSEFVAGILVGVGLGWMVDRFAGTSPWGLIVFLLLGFAAGVLNVLRSTGQVADFGAGSPDKGDDGRKH